MNFFNYLNKKEVFKFKLKQIKNKKSKRTVIK